MSLWHLFFSLVFIYVLIAFVEYMTHRFLMHSRRIAKYFASEYLYDTFLDHIRHHHVFYKIFNYEPDPVGRRLNLKLALLSTLVVVAVPALSLWFIDPLTSVLLVPAALLYRCVFNLVHSEMHLAEGSSISEMFWYRHLRRVHFLHHKHPTRKFNVIMPCFDLIFGTDIRANDRDIAEMKSLGFW